MTGWNLPPGCTNKMIEDAFGGDGPCIVCGKAIDDCICAECPVCESVGDPVCYEKHGMKLTKEQALSRQNVRIALLQERLNDAKYYYQLVQDETIPFIENYADDPDPWW